MDFKRIEIIFLLSFLLLDIFLLNSYFDRTNLNYATIGTNQVNLVREMENQGISLPEMVELEEELSYFQVEAHTLLEDQSDELKNQTGTINEVGTLYSSILSNPLALSDNEDELTEADRAMIDAFVNSENILYGEEYAFFEYLPNQNKIIYSQLVEGIPIADGTSSITFYIDNTNEIISYEQTYAGEGTMQGSPVETITDREAVEMLFQNNEIPRNSIVFKPRLTYYRTLSLEDLSMYAPSWYVKIQSSSGTEILRVDALNHNIITGLPSIPSAPEPKPDSEENMDENDDENAETEDLGSIETTAPEDSHSSAHVILPVI
ncbi:two-component system regulatory protein YycI [Lacticigenium naphthae]|uniref:two-component system regulatory protein YycI n=1 Tax=Lacticigenium naphthae TaxID=515351 RepID=UPI00041875AF|nr:two-component system regulatory protein YycI [Lacticigenium naphthae]